MTHARTMKAPMNMPGKKPAMKVPPENLVQTAGGRGEVESMPWIVVDGAIETVVFVELGLVFVALGAALLVATMSLQLGSLLLSIIHS